MSSRMTSSALQRLLLTNSTTRYFIEYGGFLSNHLAHGVVALHELGASHDRVEEFIAEYRRKVDDAGRYTDHHTVDNGDDLLGRRRGYYVLVSRYEGLLRDKYGGDMERLIAGEVPSLTRGLAGSALHGLIHTGYGQAACCPRLVCEGLAYWHFSYLPLTTPLTTSQGAELVGQGSRDVFDVIEELSRDDELYEHMVTSSVAKDAACRTHGTFQPRVAALLTTRADQLSAYVRQVKLPVVSHTDDDLLLCLVRVAVSVYVAATDTPNDFFLLHGVTSAWCLRRLLRIVDRHDVTLDSAHTWLCVLLAAYLAQDRPRLRPAHLTTPTSLTWAELVERAVASHYDEHVYKLVHVCRDMAVVEPEHDNLYRLAASSDVSHELRLIAGNVLM